MKKIVFISLLVFATVAFLLGKSFDSVYADPPNPPWCHCEPNGNCQTLYLPNQALEQAGHVNASGNPLHAGDHAGECATPTATATATATPTQEPCDGECDPTPTPTATATATSTSNGDICANIDEVQTSLPEGSHLDASGKNCVWFGVPGVPESTGGAEVLGASTQGQVLGASTMAGTGAVEDAIFNSIFTLGSLLTSFGIIKNSAKYKVHSTK